MDTVQPAGWHKASKQGRSKQFDTEFHKVHRLPEKGFFALRAKRNSNLSVQLCVHFVKLCVELLASFPAATAKLGRMALTTAYVPSRRHASTSSPSISGSAIHAGSSASAAIPVTT